MDTATTTMTMMSDDPIVIGTTFGVQCDTCGVLYRAFIHDNGNYNDDNLTITSPRTGMVTIWSLGEAPQCNNDDDDHLHRGGTLFLESEYTVWLQGFLGLPKDRTLSCPKCGITVFGDDPAIEYPCSVCIEHTAQPFGKR